MLLLLLVVLAPTVCVLWVTAQATLNERLAIRQKLTDSYARRLDDMPAQAEAYWQGVLDELKRRPVTDANSARARFAEAVSGDTCDGLVFYGSDGAVLYPAHPLAAASGEPEDPEWAEARRLEYEAGDYNAAATAYANQAPKIEECRDSAMALRRALALLAQARCLAKAGDATQAIAVLTGPLPAVMDGAANDEAGRSIALNAQLRAIELMPQTSDTRAKAVQTLAETLVTYSPTMPISSAQRRFLMRRLLEIDPASLPKKPLVAEDLSAAYLESDPAPAEPGVLSATVTPGVWSLVTQDRSCVALFTEKTIHAASYKWAAPRFSDSEATAQLLPANSPAGTSSLRIPDRAGSFMPGWVWEIDFHDPDPFAAAADQRVLVYVWTAGLTILCAMLFATLLGYFVTRQLRLTRLKNELIDIVSHELKTPLAGMRVLVDTLLNGRCPGREQELEYLRLIERENTRLSHLIDNLLTFSRMERNRQVFEFNTVNPTDVVNAAVDAMRDRCISPGCRIEVDIHPDLPELQGDRDALTTVLINLLDNAFKYSGDEKILRVRASADGARVRLEVQDNGIGLSRRAARRVFERFYQVDRSLSRRAGGCGLGLSIVKFIVTAHGGMVDVRSEPGKGSTFTVSLPVDGVAKSMGEGVPAE